MEMVSNGEGGGNRRLSLTEKAKYDRGGNQQTLKKRRSFFQDKRMTEEKTIIQMFHAAGKYTHHLGKMLKAQGINVQYVKDWDFQLKEQSVELEPGVAVCQSQ